MIQHSGVRGKWISELEANLVYRASSETARAKQRKLSLKPPPKNNDFLEY